MIQFLHHTRHIMLTAEVIRTAPGNPTLGEWKVMDNAAPNSSIVQTNFSSAGARLASGEDAP